MPISPYQARVLGLMEKTSFTDSSVIYVGLDKGAMDMENSIFIQIGNDRLRLSCIEAYGIKPCNRY